jgi:hypothetical protein
MQVCSPRPIAHNARVTSSKTRNDQNHIKRSGTPGPKFCCYRVYTIEKNPFLNTKPCIFLSVPIPPPHTHFSNHPSITSGFFT